MARGLNMVVSFVPGGKIEVRWREQKKIKREIFDEVEEAMGFVCEMREEVRDQPCILIPPNALMNTVFSLGYEGVSVLVKRSWEAGQSRARDLLAPTA